MNVTEKKSKFEVKWWNILAKYRSKQYCDWINKYAGLPQMHGYVA